MKIITDTGSLISPAEGKNLGIISLPTYLINKDVLDKNRRRYVVIHNNLDLNLMNLLVCELNSLYNCPNANNWQEAEDLISLYTYLGLYSEMAIAEDIYTMIDLWNSRLKKIYKDMLTKINEICLKNEEKTSVILELYSSHINLDEEDRYARKLTKPEK